MIVSEMRDRMGAGEFVLWSRYHARIAQREDLERKRAG